MVAPLVLVMKYHVLHLETLLFEEPGEPDKTITQTTSSPSQFKQHRVSQWEEKVDKEKDARDVGCNNHLLPGVL